MHNVNLSGKDNAFISIYCHHLKNIECRPFLKISFFLKYGLLIVTHVAARRRRLC
jgi:hypothetical protein